MIPPHHGTLRHRDPTRSGDDIAKHETTIAIGDDPAPNQAWNQIHEVTPSNVLDEQEVHKTTASGDVSALRLPAIVKQEDDRAPVHVIAREWHLSDMQFWGTLYMHVQVLLVASLGFITVLSFAILMPAYSDTQPLPKAPTCTHARTMDSTRMHEGFHKGSYPTDTLRDMTDSRLLVGKWTPSWRLCSVSF